MIRDRSLVDAKITSVVEFLVEAATPHRILTDATASGLSAAREVAGPTVDAAGSLGSARGERRSVRIALTLRATPAAALQAEAAFARTFLALVHERGFAADRP